MHISQMGPMHSVAIRLILKGSFRWLAIAACLTAALPSHAQRSEDWLPIKPQDLSIKSVPGDPGAPAVLLYFADYRDDTYRSQFLYYRIKILTGQGKQYGDVQLPVPKGYSISDIQARTIR